MRTEYMGYDIEVDCEEQPEIPDWLFGEIAYLKKSPYILGTKQVEVDNDFLSYLENDCIYIPVYALVHGGATIRASYPFGDTWDSGQSGWAYIEKTAAKEEFGWDRLNHGRIEKVRKMLSNSVREFNYWLTGEVYYYSIEKDGEFVESCYGFYGDADYAMDAAKDLIDGMVKNE